MINPFEISIDATVTDILDHLERDTQRIHSFSFRDDVLVTYSRIHINNTVTIYSKIYLNGEPWKYISPGTEVVSYEVFRATDTRSIIKCWYDSTTYHERLLFFYLIRLYQVVGAEREVVTELMQHYEQLDAKINDGKHWEHIHGLKIEIAGLTMEAYGRIQNTPDSAKDATVYKVMALEDKTGWDRTLIEMWNKGHSRDEIALRVKVSKDRVTNRVTELRNKFGENIVPYNKDRKKQLLKS